jgi:hypothetical protein
VFSNFTAPAATKEARVEILKVSFRHRLLHRSIGYQPYTQFNKALKPESSSMLMLRIMKTVKKAEI